MQNNNKLGWVNRNRAAQKAREVGGTVIELESGRYLARGQDLIDRNYGQLAPLYYGPRGKVYVRVRVGGGIDLTMGELVFEEV